MLPPALSVAAPLPAQLVAAPLTLLQVAVTLPPAQVKLLPAASLLTAPQEVARLTPAERIATDNCQGQKARTPCHCLIASANKSHSDGHVCSEDV